ncbi:MAG: SDR family oxidoreductase [Actinomycetia bacterium]|nr:SDR family oxidoreductase [Actinomycetes bacterium]
MRVLVTGGAGFLGSHLCEELLARGDRVICLDDLSSGRRENIAHLIDCERFVFIQADGRFPIAYDAPVDAVAHLASPASPRDYLSHPIDSLTTGSHGTYSALRFAEDHRARFVLASTSEVYGDPLVHPQPETYWGNVNPIGPRSVYDEAKRFAEALSTAYRINKGVDVGIIRIFNTYGPRMRAGDGRVVTTFIVQALRNVPVSVCGNARQTRSFCYVDDLVRGIVAMLDSSEPGPINLGNPQETSIQEFAELVIELTGSDSSIVHCPLPVDDPVLRKPVIDLAVERLGWSPSIEIRTGLARTIEWFREHRAEVDSVTTESMCYGVIGVE